jgi:putative phage-type endonuclease
VSTATAVDRRTFLGGSDMAAILGLSPWKTPYQLWLEKTSEAPPEDNDSGVKRRGRRLEPVIVDWMREDYGLKIIAHNERYVDQELPFLSCEVDFEHDEMENGVVITENAEVKTVHPSHAKDWGDEWSDEIPLYYTAQAAFGQMITGRESTLFAVLIGADDLRAYRVKRDDELISTLREKAIRFWALVEKRTPPPIINLQDARLAWSVSQPGSITATDEVSAWVKELQQVKKIISGREAEAELLEMKIASFMQEKEQLLDARGNRLATWKLQRRKGYTVEPTEFRVMRTTGKE